MDRYKVFLPDPGTSALEEIHELVNYLHNDHQHYVVMVDPRVHTRSVSLSSALDDLEIKF